MTGPQLLPCDVHGCSNTATEVLIFRDQPGHVHVCPPCGAVDREHCDVVWSGPAPCPWPELDATVWVDVPVPLDEGSGL